MSGERDAELVARAAADRDIPAELLSALLDLEKEIPEANAWGAETLLARRVAEILDGASARPPALQVSKAL